MNIQIKNDFTLELAHKELKFETKIWSVSFLTFGENQNLDVFLVRVLEKEPEPVNIENNLYCFDPTGKLIWTSEPPTYRFFKSRIGDQLYRVTLDGTRSRYLFAWNSFSSFIISKSTGRLIKRLTCEGMDWAEPADADEQYGDDTTPYDNRTQKERLADAPEKLIFPTIGAPTETAEDAVLCDPNERVDLIQIEGVWGKSGHVIMTTSLNDGHSIKIQEDFKYPYGLKSISVVTSHVILLIKGSSEPLTLDNQITVIRTAMSDTTGSIEDPRKTYLDPSTNSIWHEFFAVENEPNQAIGIMTGGERFNIDLKTGQIIMKC